MTDPIKMSKAEVARVLERVGLKHGQVEEILKELPHDPVDFDRDSAILDRHGLTRTHVTEMMGGSP
ncbi:MAG TPA: hypothetical protein VGM12_07660 [Trebonia sp.]